MVPGEHHRLEQIAADDPHRGQIEEVAEEPQSQGLAEAKRQVQGSDQPEPADQGERQGRERQTAGCRQQAPVLRLPHQVLEDIIALGLNGQERQNA